MRVAVVGHVEWIEFARVPALPAPGAIVHATETWQEPGGGGAVTAVQLAKLADDVLFMTALGDDYLGHRAYDVLTALGVRVEATWHRKAQRRGFVHLDGDGERTITVIGDRLGPSGDDPLPWDELADRDAVYLTAGDVGAVRRARAARTLVSTARALDALEAAVVPVDALVASAKDAGETYVAGQLDPEPALVVRTAGSAGGSWERPPVEGRRAAAGDGSATGVAEGPASGEWAATPLPGPVEDAYGCGDSFAGGLTWALGAGLAPERAVIVGARCGAACLTGRGPYAGQLGSAD